jgi:DMSO/TMAO reductase YedYZ molybdopterin-dependent catalytic subunit
MAPLVRGEPWGTGAVSTAVWTGPPLGELIAPLGLDPGVIELVVEGADRGYPEGRGAPGPIPFARALPVAKALHPDTLLAVKMNGRALPLEHGAPVRLIVPGWYGMASVKWVVRITAVTTPFQGWYQTARYLYALRSGDRRPVTTMRVGSRLTSPAAGDRLPRGRVRACGWAWSGEGPIDRVELIVDAATVVRGALRPQSGYAWTRFAAELILSEPGRHTVAVRATDAAGRTQPGVAEWNELGYGNNSVTPVCFEVY